MFYTLPQWVQMVTQIATTITAIMVARYAYLQYLKTPTQKPEQKPESIPEPILEKSKTMLGSKLVVFQTSKQKTTLIVDDTGLTCLLEDPNLKNSGIQWTINPDEANEILKNNQIDVNAGYKPNTGTFDIGRRKNWLYSKKLFGSELAFLESLKNMVGNAAQYSPNYAG